MALTLSSEARLGSEIPAFELRDFEGRPHRARDLFGARGLLVAVTCNHCPYAQAIWPRLVALAAQARGLGVNTVAINPNLHPDYPEDSVEGMARQARWTGLDFPYLADETQDVSRALGATCTPEFFLYDGQGVLVYHGRFDDNWKDAAQVKDRELQAAVEDLAGGRPVCRDQKPAMGCSIKWKDPER